MTNKFQKFLLKNNNRKRGRNNRGIITSRHRGGGHKRLYRKIDFKRTKITIPASVKEISYDPNRTAPIALLHYKDGEKRFIIQPLNLRVGDEVSSHPKALIRIGNTLPLKNIPLGTQVHNIELVPGKGGQLARSGGTSAQIIAKEENFVTLRLPSNEVRLIPNNCWATIGQTANSICSNIITKKAGRKRWLGCRPSVRGVAMNAVDHPHGGGEGRAPIGRSHPVTPWGKATLGRKTRKINKYSNSLILRRRK